MTRTLAIFALVVVVIGCGCASSPEDDLQFEEDGGKADVVRPYGTFTRMLSGDDDGLTLLRLNEDRTYEASQQLANCGTRDCTDEFAGKYRFARSNGMDYVVLYNGDDRWYSFKYKLTGDILKLAYSGSNMWWEMQRASDALITYVYGNQIRGSSLTIKSDGSLDHEERITPTDIQHIDHPALAAGELVQLRGWIDDARNGALVVSDGGPTALGSNSGSLMAFVDGTPITIHTITRDNDGDQLDQVTANQASSANSLHSLVTAIVTHDIPR